MKRRPVNLEAVRRRLLKKTRKAGGHLLWTGATQRQGYGVTRYPGQRHPITAHRAFYLAFVGPVPAGHDVHHTHDCPPSCCDWRHLRPVREADNRKRQTGIW